MFLNKCNVHINKQGLSSLAWSDYSHSLGLFHGILIVHLHNYLFPIVGCFWRTQLSAQNRNILYSFLSFFCCLSSVTCARLTIPWWRQAHLELKLLLKQHVTYARKKTHGTASQPCLDLESLLAISCYVWPFLLQGALPVKSCRYSLTWAWGVFHWIRSSSIKE